VSTATIVTPPRAIRRSAASNGLVSKSCGSKLGQTTRVGTPAKASIAASTTIGSPFEAGTGAPSGE